MPKEKRDRSSVSFNRSKSSSFPCGSSQPLLSSTKNPLENEENVKEWEGARCPVCMEHPHNAILLMCSSHDKGCHPFMCDTSYRHSNCFDQFRKSFKETSPTIAQQEDTPVSASTAHSTAYSVISESTATNFQVDRNDEGSSPLHSSCDNLLKGKMVCPLCRGHINGWMVMEPARVFMNAKSRSCACETCDFFGTYTDLRKHARLVHPLVRPSEADPDRQRDWRMIEQQRDFGDLISTLQSSIGEERSEDTMLSFDEGGWLTVFFLIRVFRRRSSSRGGSLSRTSSARVVTGRRRLSTNGLWGESYDDGNSRDWDNESSDDGSGHLRPHERRIRRRTTPDEQS